MQELRAEGKCHNKTGAVFSNSSLPIGEGRKRAKGERTFGKECFPSQLWDGFAQMLKGRLFV